MCRSPALSAQVWPYRSTEMQLLMEIMLSSWAMVSGAFTYSRGATTTEGFWSAQSYRAWEPKTMPAMPLFRWMVFRVLVSFPALKSS